MICRDLSFKYQNKTIIIMTSVEVLTNRVEVLEKQLAMLLNDNKSPPESNGTKKSKKKNNKHPKEDEGEEDKPKKKRISGYLLFSKVNRDTVKTELFGDDKPKNSEIMIELGKRWKALSDLERDEWNVKAKEEL